MNVAVWVCEEHFIHKKSSLDGSIVAVMEIDSKQNLSLVCFYLQIIVGHGKILWLQKNKMF